MHVFLHFLPTVPWSPLKTTNARVTFPSVHTKPDMKQTKKIRRDSILPLHYFAFQVHWYLERNRNPTTSRNWGQRERIAPRFYALALPPQHGSRMVSRARESNRIPSTYTARTPTRTRTHMCVPAIPPTRIWTRIAISTYPRVKFRGCTKYVPTLVHAWYTSQVP